MIHMLSGHIVLYKILLSTEKFKYNGCDCIAFAKYLSKIGCDCIDFTKHYMYFYMHGSAFDHVVYYNHDKLTV